MISRRRKNPLTSIIITLAILGITATFFGLSDVVKDAFGSLANFADMKKSDFRDNDIIHGTITETMGCAATRDEYHYRKHGKSSVTTYYYYVVPFFDSDNSPIPEKVILYRTANRKHIDSLDALKTETFNWYSGTDNKTYTKVTVDRAEVCAMSSDEWDAFADYVDRFLDAYYDGLNASELQIIKDGYLGAMVHHVVAYSAETSIFLIIGLAALGVLALIFVFIAVKNRIRSSRQSDFTYIGSSGSDPNLNAATGLTNASDDPFFSEKKSSVRQVTSAIEAELALRKTEREFSKHTGFLNTDLTRQTKRPVQLVDSVTEILNKRRQMMSEREMNFDPYTGKPLNKSSEPLGDSMPTVDPKTEENVDLSNGGIAPNENGTREFVMPFNGAIPVVNPDSAHNPANFDMTSDGISEVTPIHPATSAENISLDIQVEQTDPSMRGMMPGATGGEMNAVDPYTEKNVDVSNGGIELDDESVSRMASFPKAAPITPPEPVTPIILTTPEEPTAPVAPVAPVAPAETVFNYTPMPDISFPTAEPISAPAAEKAAEPVKEPDGYNIFKTGSSSYNIFKTDDKPSGKDGKDNMGFPDEKKFPELDKSFPTAGDSDVGGQDDFIF